MSTNLKELRQTITAMFRKFSMDPHHSPLMKQKDREQAGRFIDRIHTESFDTAGLPYYSKNGLAKGSNKAECVFALMCDVVLSYWSIACPQDGVDHVLSGYYEKDLDAKLKRLQNAYDNYDQLKVLGDTKGYCLFESQRKDLYDKKETQIIKASEVTNLAKLIEDTKPDDDSGEAQVVDHIDCDSPACEEYAEEIVDVRELLGDQVDEPDPTNTK